MSLHEVFNMFKDSDEDMSPYKECFLDLLGDDTPKIMKTINKHLSSIMFNYINNHGQNNAISPKSEGPKDSENPFQHSETLNSLKKPNLLVKKRQTIMIS